MPKPPGRPGLTRAFYRDGTEPLPDGLAELVQNGHRQQRPHAHAGLATAAGPAGSGTEPNRSSTQFAISSATPAGWRI